MALWSASRRANCGAHAGTSRSPHCGLVRRHLRGPARSLKVQHLVPLRSWVGGKGPRTPTELNEGLRTRIKNLLQRCYVEQSAAVVKPFSTTGRSSVGSVCYSVVPKVEPSWVRARAQSRKYWRSIFAQDSKGRRCYALSVSYCTTWFLVSRVMLFCSVQRTEFDYLKVSARKFAFTKSNSHRHFHLREVTWQVKS